MYTGKTVFSQLMDFLPMYEFRKCVDRYSGNYHTSSFSCMDQYLCMAFAQLTYRESLRDIEACLRSRKEKLYHLGIRGRVSRSTLAEANEKRDWRMYADFCQILISQARSLYADEDFGVELKETAYALDSTTIDLCLSLFPWASFRKHKAAVKMHTLLDLRGNIPSFIEITEGTLHDVNILDILVPEPGSFYIMDRGYLDFERLYVLTQLLAFFVTRAKKNTKVPENLLPSGGSNRRSSIRSDHHVGYAQITGGLSRKTPPCKVLRCRTGESSSFFSPTISSFPH